jgi:hypothetical protein
MSNASTIRPGLLVSLKSTVRGGVTYERYDIRTGEKISTETADLKIDATKEQEDDNTEVKEWVTKRTIIDKEEHARAVKCRSQALALIRKICSATSFGLLCPNEQEGALDAAIKAARKLTENFNDLAQHSRVAVFMLKGRVASDDAEAARSLAQECGELLAAMNAGITNFDPEAIRKAANRAREVASMLSEESQGKVNDAIEQARKAARTIVKRIEKAGEDNAKVLQDIQRGLIESARVAFLDMSGDSDEEVEAMPAVQAQRVAGIDMSTDDVVSENVAPVTHTLDLSDDDVEVMAASGGKVMALDLS